MPPRRENYRFVLIGAGVLLAMAIAAPWLVWGSLKSMERMYNRPVQWVSKDFPQRVDLERFTAEFRVADSVILSWPGCTIDDPRLERFAETLMGVQRARARDGQPVFVAEVLTGYGAVRALAREPLGLSRQQAIARLQGMLVGPDGKTSCAAIALTEAGTLGREATIDMILDAAKRSVGMPRGELHLAGAIVDGAAIDAEALRSMNLFALPSAIISLLVCYFFLRSWSLTLSIMAVGAFGEGAILLLLYLMGVEMNAVLAVLAPLTFVLAVSLGIHLSNYYRNEVAAGNVDRAIPAALRAAWWPCAMCALSSMLGFNALNVSQILPVQQFGFYSAIGVAMTALLLFAVVPGGMQLDTILLRRSSAAQDSLTTTAQRPSVWARLTTPMCRYAGLVTFATLAVMVAAGWGLTHLTTSVQVRDLLDDDSRVLRDYHWLEEHVGPLVSVEVVINFAADSPYGPLERLALVREIQDEVDRLNDGHRSMSAATFLPEIPPPGGLRQMLRRDAIRQHIERQLPALTASHLVFANAERQSWRISARLPATGNIDYGLFLAHLGEHVDPIIGPHAAKGVSAVFTGLTPVVYAAQRELLRDMFYSFLAAFVAIGAAMIVVQRNVGLGLLAMIPNVLPAVVVFGLMGWLDLAVDIGTMMTASVAIGIAVDDAIHFLAWFRQELAAGRTPREAVRGAAQHCGWAMFQTSVICSLGMLVFALSGFVPTRRFAWMMGALLMIAVTGNLVLLPPLLVGPLGRLFRRRTAATAAAEEVVEEVVSG